MKIVLFFFCLIFLAFSKQALTETSKEKMKFYIVVSIEDCRLWLYQFSDDGSLKLLKEYPVSTVRQNIRTFPLGEGYIIAKETKAAWYPTPSTRHEFAKRGIILPAVIPPGHPLNYMGTTKIYLSHVVKGKGTVYRIHGTRPQDRKKIGKRVSGGCIRMLNEDIEELVRIVPIGTQVNIIMKKLAPPAASF